MLLLLLVTLVLAIFGQPANLKPPDLNQQKMKWKFGNIGLLTPNSVAVKVKKGLVQQGSVSVGFVLLTFCLLLFLSFSCFCCLSCNLFVANVMRSTSSQHERSVMVNAWLNIAENKRYCQLLLGLVLRGFGCGQSLELRVCLVAVSFPRSGPAALMLIDACFFHGEI